MMKSREWMFQFCLGLALAMQGGKPATKDNVPAFAVLCEVLQAAETRLPESETAKALEAAEKIQKSIQAVADSLERDKSGEKTVKEGNTGGTAAHIKPEGDTVNLCVIDELKDEVSRKVLAKKLQHSFEEVKEISLEIKEEEKTTKRLRAEIEKHMAEAIYGEGAIRVEGLRLTDSSGKNHTVQEWLKTAVGTNSGDSKIFHDATDASGHAASCGNTASANAGKTLINDFYCLCVGKGVASVADPCATGIQGKSSGGNTWTKMGSSGDKAPDHGEGWKLLRGKCSLKADVLATSFTIQAALAKFRGALGAQVQATSDSKSGYILGKATAGNTGCTGADGQVCVHYYKPLSGGSESGIAWENHLTQAAKDIEELEKSEATARGLLNQLHTVRRRSRQACEEALFLESVAASNSTQPVPRTGTGRSGAGGTREIGADSGTTAINAASEGSPERGKLVLPLSTLLAFFLQK